MKTLYFVGNEELWSDAWFTALIESLSKREKTTIVLLDQKRDEAKILLIGAKLQPYDRLIVQRDLNIKIPLAGDAKSLMYELDRKEQLDVESLLGKMGISDATRIFEDEFLHDPNVNHDVAKALEGGQTSQIDVEALSSSEEEMGRFLEDELPSDIKGEFSKIQELAIEPKFEPKFETKVDEPVAPDVTEISLASEALQELSEVSAISIDPIVEKNLESFVLEEPKLEEPKIDEPKVEEEEPSGFELEPDANDPLAPLQAEAVAPPPQVEMPAAEPTDDDEGIKPFSDEGKSQVEVSHLISSMSNNISNEDLEVLKRYSSLKERELRESQATGEALRRQIKYFDERLKRSEEDRRKLIVVHENLQNELRTIQDKKDDYQVQLKNIESRYEEKIKELHIQLESSQYQAGKLEKKLEDFRERVRSDLQKIRVRERELASRLEIQKRDAEALLSAKDERLLNQKREIDRLEFELESLKERLIEDAQKNEERKKRLARAIQSLKLAQSVLTGIDDEIIASLERDDKDKAA